MPSLSRGMTTPALLFSILSSTLLAIRPASGTAIGLPSEIVSFVPSCATVCLSTFIDANFPQGLCGTEPTFQCLCAHTGTNGFTVGEGALACIASEDNMGQCTGTDASPTASNKAYSMCYGQASAAPETHATIVATLVIPSQSQSTKTVTTTVAGNTEGNTDGYTTTRATTTPSTSTPTRTSTTSARTTTPSTESLLLTAPPLSSTITAASLPTTSTKSAPGTSSAQTGASSEQPQPGKGISSLSVAQIVGISVGTAAALFLAIGLSIYLRFVRRRRLMLVPRMTGDGNQGDRDSDVEGPQKRFRPRTGHELQISVPVNLQAPMHTLNNAGPSWQEKYKHARKAPQDTDSTQHTENRPDPPPKNPLAILTTRPILERPNIENWPVRAEAPNARNNRSLTPRTVNGRLNDLPRGGIQAPPRTTANRSAAQSDVPPSLLIWPPPQRTPPARRPEEVAVTVPRPVPYPSYYGIAPDEDQPDFGYSQWPTYTEPPPGSRQPTQIHPTQTEQERNLPAVFQSPLINRDSIVTEFAEDGEEDLSPRGTDDGRYPSRQFPSRQDPPQQQYGAKDGGYASATYTYQQPQPSPRPLRQPLPQFQVQPHHQPQLRPQPPPRTPSPRAQGRDPVDDSPRPFMSPSLVPRPLDLGSRNTGNAEPVTLTMPDGAGSNVSRMAKMRLGDERALGLRLAAGDRRPQRPRQNAGWRRMDDNPGEY